MDKNTKTIQEIFMAFAALFIVTGILMYIGVIG